jgi:hypothetical protein
MNYSKIWIWKSSYLLIVSSLLASVVFAEPVLYEAENESAASSESILDSVGASGGKYVMTSSGMSFMVSVTETANYDIVASTFVPTYGWFNTAITVNGTKMGEFLTKDQTGGRTPYTLETTQIKSRRKYGDFSGGASWYRLYDCRAPSRSRFYRYPRLQWILMQRDQPKN